MAINNAFRHWLRMVHNPANFSDLMPDASRDGMAAKVGLMSYRYMTLCWKDPMQLQRATSADELKMLDRENCYINSFIRQERLEDDLWETLESLNLVSEADRPVVYHAQKANTSHRPRNIRDYYDDASIELVAYRDKLLIDKFGYKPNF